MFRHERPQKGRFRQFHQFGAEVFGVAEAEIDAELILMTARLWRELGLKDIRLELNTLGSLESRASYREVLVDYLRSNSDDLDADSLKRIDTNPLRVLDSKNKKIQALIKNAPNMHDYLDDDSKQHFDKLRQYLDAANISYTINPGLVRGLDYYCKTVFEWVTDKLGAQGTVCAGGRYDGLVEQLGGKDTPAAGFALGVERLLSLMEESDVAYKIDKLDVYLMSQSDSSVIRSMKLAEALRDKFPELKIVTNFGAGSLKNKMKKADKSGTWLALVVGDSDVELKHLRGEKQNQENIENSIKEFLKTQIQGVSN
jgi:histidyl-tRNA synthetase